MKTKEDLVKLLEEGQLGQYVATRFGGTRGCVSPVADSDFMIGFPSKKEVPSKGIVLLAAHDFLQNQGFCFELYNISPQSWTGSVSLKSTSGNVPDGDQIVSIQITANYPPTPGEGRNHIRLTTMIIP